MDFDLTKMTLTEKKALVYDLNNEIGRLRAITEHVIQSIEEEKAREVQNVQEPISEDKKGSPSK